MPAVPLKMTPESLAHLSVEERKDAIREVALERYERPRANQFVMRVSSFLIRHLGFPGMPILGRIPILRRWFPFLAGVRVVEIDLPDADEARLKRVTQKENAAFISCNHAELFTDVLIDWHVLSGLLPRLAFWAGYAIVNNPLLRPFWINHNLISTSPGGDGKRYSTENARRGDGVLIHPEGNVFWTNNHIHPIFPGVATLSLDAASAIVADGDPRPVFVQPMIWKYRFDGDASDGLSDELTFVEKRLWLDDNRGMSVGPRFFTLMKSLLRREESNAGLEEEPLNDADYFARSATLIQHLLKDAEAELKITPENDDDRVRTLNIEKRARFLKVKNPTRFRAMTKRVATLRRLHLFSPTFYGTPLLSQEEIAETLKRIRQDLVEGKFTDEIRRWMPFPAADRVVHIRVGEPIDVREFLKLPPGGARVESLRALVEQRMRDTMSTLLGELKPQLDAFAVKNAFVDVKNEP